MFLINQKVDVRIIHIECVVLTTTFMTVEIIDHESNDKLGTCRATGTVDSQQKIHIALDMDTFIPANLN